MVHNCKNKLMLVYCAVLSAYVSIYTLSCSCAGHMEFSRNSVLLNYILMFSGLSM